MELKEIGDLVRVKGQSPLLVIVGGKPIFQQLHTDYEYELLGFSKDGVPFKVWVDWRVVVDAK